MSVTDIHCTVDKMGRIVLPAQVRRMLDFSDNGLVEFLVTDNETEIVTRG